MAESVHLFLRANGTDIKGESTQTSLGRDASIECISFDDAVRTARERGTGQATGRRTYEAIRINKRIDASSPLLAKALCNNEEIDGEFCFYRPSPTGDGTTEQFFTISISQGRISSIARRSPNAIDPASSVEPPTEEVAFVFHTIRWTYNGSGHNSEHEDSWANNS
ncbi:MAG: type VI secretion system tube protein TssD [Nannocystaceae bacterium]